MSDEKQNVEQALGEAVVAAAPALEAVEPAIEKSAMDFLAKDLKSLKDRFESFVVHLENKYGVREPHKDIR